MIWRNIYLLIVVAALLVVMPMVFAASNVTIYPAPAGEPLSSDYTLQAGGQAVPVYKLKVAPGDANRRMDAGDYAKNVVSHISDEAAFAYFDMQGAVAISVTYKDPITSAKLLPDVPGVKLTTSAKTVSFVLNDPRNLTLEINHDLVRTLHIFASATGASAPAPNDPNVVYFGPGVHDVSNLVVGDGKTLYIAGGAIVRVVAGAAEAFRTNAQTGQRSYDPAIKVQGSGIKIRGRGIIDGSMVPQGKSLLQITGNNISVEGIILNDSSSWTLPIRNSKNVVLTNVKVLGYRLNTDGIDIVSSQTVTVTGCFVRTFDDLIVVKAVGASNPSSNITARGNILWAERAHAMTIGTEVQSSISDVTFADTDLIRGIGNIMALGVVLGDAGSVTNVHFDNIRADLRCIPGMPANKCPILVDLRIGNLGRGDKLGNIRDVSFNNIRVTTWGPTPQIGLAGFSNASDVEGVLFDNVIVNGHPISKNDIKQNPFVKNVAIKP